MVTQKKEWKGGDFDPFSYKWVNLDSIFLLTGQMVKLKNVTKCQMCQKIENHPKSGQMYKSLLNHFASRKLGFFCDIVVFSIILILNKLE